MPLPTQHLPARVPATATTRSVATVRGRLLAPALSGIEHAMRPPPVATHERQAMSGTVAARSQGGFDRGQLPLPAEEGGHD